MKKRALAGSVIYLKPNVRFEVDVEEATDENGNIVPAHTKWIDNKDNDPEDQVVVEVSIVPNGERSKYQRYGSDLGGGEVELINDFDACVKKYAKKVRGLENEGITTGAQLVEREKTWQVEVIIKEAYQVAMGISTAGRETVHMSPGEANASV